MTSSGKEKRRHSRLPIDLQYLLIINDREYRGHINNISLIGAYLATVEPELSESCVGLQGMLNIHAESGWVTLKCEIVYIGSNDKFFPSGAGIAFCQSDDDTASAVWNLAMQYLVQDNQLFAPVK